VSYRTEVRIFKKSLCFTYIKTHWTSYILSFEKNLELLCREPSKVSFKVNESSHILSVIAKSSPCQLFSGSVLLTICQLEPSFSP